MELIVAILIGLFVIREYVTYKERQKLLDRIMSKDYQEYKDIEVPEENVYGEDEKENLISLEEAKEEINGKEE